MIENTEQWRKCGLMIDSVDSPATTPVIDDIDGVLAPQFSFGVDELNALLRYDMK